MLLTKRLELLERILHCARQMRSEDLEIQEAADLITVICGVVLKPGGWVRFLVPGNLQVPKSTLQDPADPLGQLHVR